jgi:hypothetical protein
MYMERVAGTFVQISREDLEEWLDSTGFRGKWKRDPRFAGVYLLPLSTNVAIKLLSTIGSADDAMGRGRASMQLALVSTITGKVLNKKAQGQSHFARTTGWKKNWAGGIKVMKDAYQKASEFYDTLATIANREKYKQDNLNIIETIPGWSSNNYFITLHRRVDGGGVVMPNDRRMIEEGLSRPAARPDPQVVPTPEPEEDPSEINEEDQISLMRENRLNALRSLWVKANRWQPGDERGKASREWVLGFAKSIGEQLKLGRRLTPAQVTTTRSNLDKWGVKTDDNKPASTLF